MRCASVRASTTPEASLRRPTPSASSPARARGLASRRHRRRQTSSCVVASLVGFPRPSPPWSSSIRASLLASSASVGRVGEEARTATASAKPPPQPLFDSLHHVGLLVSDLERSLRFYEGVLGLEVNPDRPDDKLPYRGAWLWIGTGPTRPATFTGQMIHLMELPSPDPTEGRPAHGGRDRHFCVSVASVAAVVERLEVAGVPYTSSASGRAAAFFRDPDGNVLECAEMAK